MKDDDWRLDIEWSGDDELCEIYLEALEQIAKSNENIRAVEDELRKRYRIHATVPVELLSAKYRIEVSDIVVIEKFKEKERT
tara:strand:+ start:455 stop:700 length:246 start_codon:yes stop_codon:yes gene_type:complete